jgi:predicted small lipoprotein YifL
MIGGRRKGVSAQGSVLVNGDLATHFRRLAVLALIAGAMAACGRKGALEPSPSAAAQPAAQEGEQKAAAPAKGGISTFRAKKPAPVLPPKTPSILDPILE